MIRIHLAQIFYNQAYYDSPVDYLEEPTFVAEGDTPLGKLRLIDEIQSFLLDSKSSYIEHLRAKLTQIGRWCGERKAHILVFPEYSVPFQLLSDLKDLAQQYSMAVVARSHRVTSGDEAKSVYQSLSIPSESLRTGCAVAPIILPDGSIKLATKLKRSKWEPNLLTPDNDPKIVAVNCPGTTVQMAVVPCIDSLHPEVVGQLWGKDGNSPNVIACPSLSPSTDLFRSIGSLAASQEILFGYVNTASFGGTFFNIPETWHAYLTGTVYSVESLPKDVEVVLEIDVDPETFFAKKGSVKSGPVCSHPVPFPIVYSRHASWLKGFLELRNELIEWLENSERDAAMDWLDSYLTEEASGLPELVMQNLRYVRHALLPLYDGNAEAIKAAFDIVTLAETVENTQLLWAKRVNRGIKMLGEHLMESEDESTNSLLDCLRSLKGQQRRLPRIALAVIQGQEVTPPAKLDSPAFIGEEDLIEAFQNRGHDLNWIRSFFSHVDNRVIIVTGSIGVGKSDFLNWMFRKAFGDWETIKVHIPSGAKVARLVADVAYRVGLHLDVDSLASASQNVFRQKIRKVLQHFYGFPKRALILDDLHQILRGGNVRDHRQLDIFLEEAAAPEIFVGGRIFLVSSVWLPEKWLGTQGVSHLRLKGLDDTYAGRVIEYHMRRTGLVTEEGIPDLPQALLGMVKGHPLSARLVVDALHNKDLQSLSDELTLLQVAGHVARELLKRVTLTDDEHLIMQQISFFRLPVRLDLLKHFTEFNWHEETLMALAGRCILGYDGLSFEMHEAVRRFYEAQVSSPTMKTRFHHLAALYYQKIYDAQRSRGEKDPSIIAELVHHLGLAGELSKASDLRLLVVEEIKPTARKIYREYRDYQRALSLYKLVAAVVPDDIDALAYIGRCHARLGQWADSDRAFEKAITMALKTGRASWWLYRDWGHIRARFRFYAEAKKHLEKAAASHPNDPSIKASLAYIFWQEGQIKEASELFEEAHKLAPDHEYILTFYAKFLDSVGDHEYADSLRGRLAQLDVAEAYREPNEYDMDVEHDD